MKALQVIKNRIAEREDLSFIVNRWGLKGEKVVFTNGCFDILHQGHVDYLSKAADLGTKLVVGVNSDNSVRRLGKDKNRPIQDENSRAIILAALHLVDLVILFDEDTPLGLIKEVNPHILVKGSDYKIHKIVGYEFVTEKGGEVRTIDFLEGFSTSKIVEKARK
ncbi:D-glycero-beta-D-manno-heptose 1-phosphate adenylyltransferase [Vicingaceae bacterium]|nr:D-glycero-beta-D-manno-heptose 1-phosphate adenylyltransferase [Vicingaceae bacterium]MDC1452041.1 D-glycero-beta-D-manno-heptose 1-phosphate adenylyltransferase [Vicingaceae bacterium]